MPVVVRVPTQLRQLTDGLHEIEASGSTLASLISDIDSKHPGVAQRVLDEEGKIRRFVNVYVNEEDVRFLQGVNTPIEDSVVVSIIPAVAGG